MASPTPYESMQAPWRSRSVMRYSSSPLVANILQPVIPWLSSIFLTFTERYARSPLSSLMP